MSTGAADRKMPLTPSLSPQAGRGGDPRIKTWAGFLAMAFGMFMAILDTQIVASSLPEIQTGRAAGGTTTTRLASQPACMRTKYG